MGKHRRLQRTATENEYLVRLAAMNRVDRLLSDAQDVIGRELSSVEVHECHPQVWGRADRAWVEIEKARKELERKR